MNKQNYWGTIVDEEDKNVQIPDVTADIELSMNNFYLNDLEGDDDHLIPKTERIIVNSLNSIMQYTISLHKCANKITNRISEKHPKGEADSLAASSGDDCNKVPEMLKIPRSNVRNCLNYVPSQFTDFTLGHEVDVPELSRTVVLEILRKSVCTLFAHIGYESSQQSAIDILVDVLCDFLCKIAHVYNVTLANESRLNEPIFSYVMEKVLTETGMGGINGLSDYYQTRVIKYVNVVHDRCKNLNMDYQKLLIPKSPSPVDKISRTVKVKVEEEDVVEVENPEVHFSTIEGDVNLSILETGYQLLNSLEAETNLHSLSEGMEDITDSSSGVVSVSSDLESSSHLSPYNKKKRFQM